ncbi:thioredoxin fold domain-containing protein [Flavihumibacter sp. R14]|nr:thioredoxin fold domain-containing protein [Flavihumibacter soli]
MKILFLIVLFSAGSLFANAQEAKGIRFETGLSWTQVKEKALKENKYIFLDAYTTWCLPCKKMAKEIFPQDTVGKFFNKNFINVAAQFDVTKKDKEEVKKWYKDIELLKKAYKFDNFPTYLFFNPQGELVHSVYGASETAEEFMAKSKDALNPNMQYASLKSQYIAGNRQANFLLTLLKSALSNKDKSLIPEITTSYFAIQKDLLTPDNLTAIALVTSKPTDPGFSVLRNNTAQADLVLGKGRSAEIVKTAIFDEIFLPALRINGVKTNYGGGMSIISGPVNEKVNWSELKEKLDSKYPELSAELMSLARLTHADWLANWPLFTDAVSEYLAKYSEGLTRGQLNSYANTILRNSDDQELLSQALSWAITDLQGLEGKEKIGGLYTCSNLMYKTGKKEEAIKLVEEAIEITGGSNKNFTELLDKMNKGERTW